MDQHSSDKSVEKTSCSGDINNQYDKDEIIAVRREKFCKFGLHILIVQFLFSKFACNFIDPFGLMAVLLFFVNVFVYPVVIAVRTVKITLSKRDFGQDPLLRDSIFFWIIISIAIGVIPYFVYQGAQKGSITLENGFFLKFFYVNFFASIVGCFILYFSVNDTESEH